MLKKLPIGYSSLEKIQKQNCIYIDKTHHIHTLISAGEYYFLSRPRRFGKSLLLDTIKQAFLGNQPLFQGLYLEKHWDWSTKYPVIHIDLGRGLCRDREEMERNIHVSLDKYFEQYQLENTYTDIANRFDDLIRKLQQQAKQQVVILIDEYDKPILDNIDTAEIATEIRAGLKNFYGIIKINDARIKFVLLTGVSKFSKVNLFSDLNNLRDITVSGQYADICGYTEKELDIAFHAYLNKVDRTLLKFWYNGYDFAGTTEQKVYNPFDILLFFANDNKYQPYWIQTGNPSFLLKLLEKNNYYLPSIEQLIADDSLLDSFDVEKLNIIPLLFQTGYLTIQSITANPFDNTRRYVLNYPNHEVRTSLNKQLIHYFITDAKFLHTTRSQLESALLDKNFDLFKTALTQFFASIPYAWYSKNQLPHYEGFYASIVYSLLNAMGLDAIPEDNTNRGRIDLSVKVLNSYYLLFEFKVQKNTTAQTAIDQIKHMKYPEKYAAQGLPIYIVGMVFNAEARNVEDFAWEVWQSDDSC